MEEGFGPMQRLQDGNGRAKQRLWRGPSGEPAHQEHGRDGIDAAGGRDRHEQPGHQGFKEAKTEFHREIPASAVPPPIARRAQNAPLAEVTGMPAREWRPSPSDSSRLPSFSMAKHST